VKKSASLNVEVVSTPHLNRRFIVASAKTIKLFNSFYKKDKPFKRESEYRFWRLNTNGFEALKIIKER
jgi:hypothetical protein